MIARILKICVAWISICAGGIVHSSELISFDNIRAKYQSTRDATRITYLLSRCAALQLSLSALMLKANDRETSDIYRKSAIGYMELAGEIQFGIDEKQGIVNKNLAKDISKTVTNIVDVYVLRLNGNYAKNGDHIIGDDQIEHEIDDCLNKDKFTQKIIGTGK